MDLDDLRVGQKVMVKASNGKEFEVLSGLRTEVEINYFKNGGVLPLVMRKKLK